MAYGYEMAENCKERHVSILFKTKPKSVTLLTNYDTPRILSHTLQDRVLHRIGNISAM